MNRSKAAVPTPLTFRWVGDPEEHPFAELEREADIRETLLKWAGDSWMKDVFRHANVGIKGSVLTLTYGADGYALAEQACANSSGQGWPDGLRSQLLGLGVKAIRFIGNRREGRSDETVQLYSEPANTEHAVAWPTRLYGGHRRFGPMHVFPCKAEAKRLSVELGVEVEWVATADRTITWKLDRIDGDGSAIYNGFKRYPNGRTLWTETYRVEPSRYSIAGPGDRRGLAFELAEDLAPRHSDEEVQP